MIKANNIKLNDEFNLYKEKIETESKTIEVLKPISKINIFVGANNSGKSMFMRLLSTMKEFPVHAKSIEGLEDEREKLRLNHEKIMTEISHIEFISTSKIAIDHNDMKFLRKILEESIHETLFSYRESLENLLLQYRKLCKLSADLVGINDKFAPDKIIAIENWAKEGVKIIDNILNELKDLDDIKVISDEARIQDDIRVKTVYIPVLRGLRPLDDKFTDVYKDTTVKDYFKVLQGNSSRPDIFTGLGFYKELTNLLLGNNEQRISVQKYQEFIRENLFENKKVELIPNQTTKTVIAKIGDEIEREIHFLGDGIQSAIILTFLPFVTKEPTYFFIEEPEIYLHPGLQRKILEFFDKKCNRHKFFMTTHSNHFLDITIDIKDVSIFTFRKRLEDGNHNEKSANFIIEAVDGTNQSSLELLGVRNSSVFLVNATIWVEGITDRWYLRKMLNSYIEQNKVKKIDEDVHYCFVEYGGSNITHWSFLDEEDFPIEVERLCSKAVLVVDKDGDSKLERKKQLKRKLGNRLIVLPCREVENSLNYEVIKSVVAEYEKIDESKFPELKYEDYKDNTLCAT